ncbi:MAG: LssY C-terminal domain-containing protein [Sulfurospirillaceae bacterium]|nr:LssY C-terminal domain-containing protein [Sulfurospirillaceae bacterium]
MDFSFLDKLISFLIDYKEIAYTVLFFGSMFETIIGFSFFIYGELFFLAGSIMAGMGILNIWEVIIVLYVGGILGDSTSYFLGVKYGLNVYNKFKNVKFLNRFINEKNYDKGVKFFQKRGAMSLFFARLLGPISWITPFIAGIYKLDYKKFLLYNIPGVIIGIGQFIIIGYFFGRHFDLVLKIFSTYILIVAFVLICIIFLYYYLKKRKLLSQIKQIFIEDRKRIISFIAKNFFLTSAVLLLIYLLFLFFIFFTDADKEVKPMHHPLLISMNINQCKNFQLYYKTDKKNIIQPINVILETNLGPSDIFDKNWIKNKIFDINDISFLEYIRLLKEKTPPISSLYFDGYPQDYAYQYKSNSIQKRQHIRLWRFVKKPFYYVYYASITYDDGLSFNFYNYFYSPIHRIDKNIDKSRDFFYKYMRQRKDLNVTCSYIQTQCAISKILNNDELSDEQPYYSDGKVLLCKISK